MALKKHQIIVTFVFLINILKVKLNNLQLILIVD